MPEQTAILSPTQQQIVNAQQRAVRTARSLAGGITGVDDPESGALIREILPASDLASGGDNGWNGTDNDWTQDGLAADTTNSVYSIDSNDEAQDKIIVFYGVANVAGTVLTTEVQFQDGTGATFRRENAETLEVAEVSDVILFEEEVVYGPTEDGTVVQWPDAAGDDGMIYLAKVAEPLGNTVSTRQRPERRFAQGGGR